MSTATHLEREKGGFGSFIKRALSFLLALVLGAILTVLVFLALPFLQNISGGPKESEVISDAPTLEAPEQTQIEEPPPPPPETEEPEPEPPAEPLDAPSLAQLTDALSGSGTGGAGVISNEALKQGAADAASKMLNNAGLDKQPRATYKPAPKYPPAAGGREGSVTVQFVVQANGRVSNARVVESTSSVFDSAALEAVSKWRFEPGERGGQPAPFKLKVPIRFTK